MKSWRFQRHEAAGGHESEPGLGAHAGPLMRFTIRFEMRR